MKVSELNMNNIQIHKIILLNILKQYPMECSSL